MVECRDEWRSPTSHVVHFTNYNGQFFSSLTGLERQSPLTHLTAPTPSPDACNIPCPNYLCCCQPAEDPDSDASSPLAATPIDAAPSFKLSTPPHPFPSLLHPHSRRPGCDAVTLTIEFTSSDFHHRDPIFDCSTPFCAFPCRHTARTNTCATWGVVFYTWISSSEEPVEGSL